MGGSLINDCLTNNFLENESSVNVMFIIKEDSLEGINNCYIDEKFKPINMPFSATFCEDERIKDIDKDFNIKQIEKYFGLDINVYLELILNKPRSAFSEYDTMFFKAFNLNPKLYEKPDLATFDNCKKINDNFELIESNNEEDKFFIKTEILFSKLKLYFTFNKVENRLNIDIFQMKKDEEVFYDKYKFSNNKYSNLKYVFEKLYKKNIPIFLTYEQLSKIKEIEKTYLMIYSDDINKFIDKTQNISKINDIVNERLDNFANLILEYIDKAKTNNKKFLYIDTDTYLSKSDILNRSSNNELFKSIYFDEFKEKINDLLSENRDITKEIIFEIINKDELSKNLVNFNSLRNVMNQLDLEYKTYSLVGYPDREFELLWKEHCKEQSENFREIE